MKIFTGLFLVTFLFFSLEMHAQEPIPREVISFKKQKYYQGDQQISYEQLNDVLLQSQNVEIELSLEQATKNRKVGNTLSYLGSFALGFSVGYSLGGLIFGDEFEFEPISAISAASFLTLSIPFSRKAKKNTVKAITIYNEKIIQ